MQKISLILTCFICLGFGLTAQQTKQYNFSHYGTVGGLASNQINTVVQDAEGYLWIGSTEGLQRFDGIRYKTFRAIQNDPSSIPSNPILQLLIDKKKNLWVLTNDGKVGIFDTRKFVFREALLKVNDYSTVRYSGKKLSTDEAGNIFYSLTNELVTWNEKLNEFSKEHNIFPLPSGGVASFTHEHGTQKYWMTIKDGFIAVYNKATGNFNYPGHNPDKEYLVEITPKFKNPYNLFIDKKKRFWFQSWGAEGSFASIYCYDPRNKKTALNTYNFVDELKSYYETDEFFEQSDSTIWVTGTGVFASFNEAENKFECVHNGYQSERSIFFESINVLFEDREKNIWTGTSNNGLFRFNPSEEYFTNIDHTHRVTNRTGNGTLMSFIATKWGTILAGAWGDGLYHYDRDFNLIPTNIKGITDGKGPSAWSMFASKDSNTIWISAQPGIYAIDQANRSAKFYNPPQLENRTVRQIAEDKLGNLWIGMQRTGLYKWTASKGKLNFNDGIEKFPGITNVNINHIVIDRKGLVWVATSDDGAYVIDPATDNVVMHFDKIALAEHTLPEEGVASILDYNDSLIIMSTSKQLVIYNRVTNKLSELGTPEMLSGYVSSLEKDLSGYVWVSTTTGIYRVNIQKKIFILFNRNDGIENDNFTLAASLVLPDGRLLFGSSTQFVVFNPSAIVLNSKFPNVTITDFKVSNRSMQVDSLLHLKKIMLGPSSNSLQIEFSTLNFNSAYLVKYKLEGIDKEWRIADKNNQAIYSYLPPGTYTFLAKTLDSEANEGENVTSITIRIKPHFWNTWWFYSLCAVLFAFAIFLVDRERMKRKESIRKMRNDIAGNLHTEVNTALNNINLLSEMARIKADQDPQKSKEYIEQIHTKSHNMIIAMDDMLWSLDEGNDSIEKTVDRMREYVDALRNRHDANIDLLVDKKVSLLPLNMGLRHTSFLLFKDGIKNIISIGAKNLKVHLGAEKNILQFTIQFDNEDCDMQQLNNLLHRQDLEKKLQSIKAEIGIQVHKTSSVISLQIPVS